MSAADRAEPREFVVAEAVEKVERGDVLGVIWAGEVAPNRTLATLSCESAKAIASAAGGCRGRLASARRSRRRRRRARARGRRAAPRGGRPRRRRGRRSRRGRRPAYFPVSAPPASTHDATTLAPDAAERLRHRRRPRPATGAPGCRATAPRTEAGRPAPRRCGRPPRAAPRASSARPHARSLPAAISAPTDATISSTGSPPAAAWQYTRSTWSSPMRPSERVELRGGGLLRPELPPQLVGDDDLVARPAGRAEQLAEHDLRPARRDRCACRSRRRSGRRRGSDAGLARGDHDREAVARAGCARRFATTRAPPRETSIPERPSGACWATGAASPRTLSAVTEPDRDGAPRTPPAARGRSRLPGCPSDQPPKIARLVFSATETSG